MTEVPVFFYGTFMSAAVLQQFGVAAVQILPARLTGFQLVIQPRANLIPNDRSCVYGSVATVTQDALRILYSNLEQNFGLKYYPTPVLAELIRGGMVPSLCYTMPQMQPAPPDPAYIAELASCVRQLNHPEWYAEHIESLR